MLVTLSKDNESFLNWDHDITATSRDEFLCHVAQNAGIITGTPVVISRNNDDVIIMSVERQPKVLLMPMRNHQWYGFTTPGEQELWDSITGGICDVQIASLYKLLEH